MIIAVSRIDVDLDFARLCFDTFIIPLIIELIIIQIDGCPGLLIFRPAFLGIMALRFHPEIASFLALPCKDQCIVLCEWSAQ